LFREKLLVINQTSTKEVRRISGSKGSGSNKTQKYIYCTGDGISSGKFNTKFDATLKSQQRDICIVYMFYDKLLF